MVALPVVDAEAVEEYRRRQTRADKILRAASEDRVFIATAVDGAREADTAGTDGWPSIEQLERELGISE